MKSVEIKESNEIAEPRPSLPFFILWGVGILTRFWDLGTRALHHDESLHAIYSFHLAQGRGYIHDPMMHGPFQFHFTALIFWLFGDSDYTARVPPAIFGVLLLFIPWLFRRWIGKRGALATTFLLLISPSILYFSRFLREDIYSLVFTLFAVLFSLSYLEKGEKKDLTRFLISLSLLFCTKEISFLFSFILFAWFGWCALKKQQGERSKEMFLLVGGIIAPLSCALFIDLLFNKVLGLSWKSLDYSSSGAFRILTTAILIFGISYEVNRRFKFGKNFLKASFLFYGIFITLHTTFFHNGTGILSGFSGALGYWIEQHGVKRGNQPLFYYVMLLTLYEYLAMIFGLIGLRSLFKDRGEKNVFQSFLPFWLIAGFVIYTTAGEKMPWLVIHVLAPFIFSAGIWIGNQWEERKSVGNWLSASLIAFSIFSFIHLMEGSTLADDLEKTRWVLRWASAVLSFGVGIYFLPRGPMNRAFKWGASLLILAFTLKHSWLVTFENRDIAQDLLIYTQTTPQVRAVAHELDRVSNLKYGPELMPVAYDNESSWPFEWYLRRYKKRSFYAAQPNAGLREFPYILAGLDKEKFLSTVLSSTHKVDRIKLRWWFPEETYRDLYPDGSDWNWFGVAFNAVKTLFNPGSRSKFQHWFVYRELSGELGSTDILVYTKNPEGNAVSSEQNSSPEKKLYEDHFVKLSEWGNKLNSPIDLASFGNGQYVALTRNGEIFLLSSTGQILRKISKVDQPSTIAVSSDHTLYLPDLLTSNILRISLDGNMKPGLDRNTTGISITSPIRLRFDREGKLYILDSGTRRIAVLDSHSNLIRLIGAEEESKGLILLPVALGLSPNGAPLLIEASTRKIMAWNGDYELAKEIPIPFWKGSVDPTSPPGLAMIGNEVFFSDPDDGNIFKITSGNRIFRIAEGLSHPTLLLADHDLLYVVESGKNRILRSRISK